MSWCCFAGCSTVWDGSCWFGPSLSITTFVWLGFFCLFGLGFYWTVCRERVPELHPPLFVLSAWFLLIMGAADLSFWVLHHGSVAAWMAYSEDKTSLLWALFAGTSVVGFLLQPGL